MSSGARTLGEVPGERRERITFYRLVRDALSRLYDPLYLQNHQLAELIQPKPKRAVAGQALRYALSESIESLRPVGPLAANPHARRRHQVLTLRYVEGLDPERVAEQLAVSRSELYRDQHLAIEDVASLLWTQWDLGRDSSEPLGDHAPELGSVTSDDFPRPISLVAGFPPTNLPTPWNSFVGRQTDLEEVRARLATSRLVTLTGVGGSGKTRLALEVARGLLAEYDSAIWLVDLGPLAEPTLVPNLVATALGIREQAGETLEVTIRRSMRDRRLLLVLDNCEHLVDACARLADEMLQTCSGLSILATSREALRLPGEVVWPVPPLGLPPDLERSPEDLIEYAAVRLFVERAKAAQPTFAVTAENAPAIAHLCRRLDGIPLAIELAAARLTAMSVEQIAERLGDRFRLLTGGSRTALHRQQTLRAAIDWSHDLLAEPERLLFRRLAVFSGGWTLEAAEVVCAGDGIVAEEVLDLLAGLVRKSLVSMNDLGEQTRYRLLETIRQYAGEKLADSGEADAARSRHRDWCLALGGRAEAAWYGRDQLLWLARLEVEQDNLRSALRWYLKGDADAGLQLMASVWQLWDFGGQWSEGVRWLEAFLERAPARTRARAKALHALASIARTMNWITEAIQPLAEESVSVALEVGDNSTAGWALKDLGCTFILEGKYSQATAALEESLTAFRAAQNMPGVGASLRNLATTVSHLGDHATAEAHLEESLALLREVGDSWSLALTLRQLGDLTRLLGDYPKARRLFDESLDLFQRIASRDRVAQVLCDLSSLARVRGDYGEAERLLGEVEALIRAHPGWAPLARIFHEAYGELYGVLAVAKGLFVRGARLLGAADRHGSWIDFYPAHAADRSAALAAARQALGEEAFDRAWAEGQAMTLEQAVEYALGS